MRRPLASLLVVALSVPVGAAAALAHGGQYRGPPGEVPPDSRTPGDPPPPDGGGGTSTPPDDGGNTPTPPDSDGGGTPTPPDGRRPDPGPGGTPPGPTAGPGTTTKKAAGKKSLSFDSWLFWWNHNKDAILDLRRRSFRDPAFSSEGVIGRTLRGTGNEASGPGLTARIVEAEVVPLLEACARDGSLNFDIQSAAVLGLAKIGRRDQAPLLMAMARNDGTPKVHQVVEESAALALGILQDRSPEILDFLAERALDRTARTRTRCFAAFSLGLLGEGNGAAAPRSLAALRAMALGDEADRDLAKSALLGIGLLGDPAAIPDLVDWLHRERVGNRRLDDLTLAFAASALGRIGRAGASGPDSTEVLDALGVHLRRKNRVTRYSAIIALGRIGSGNGGAIREKCVEILGNVVRSEGRDRLDNQGVNFALISLGRIAGACGAEAGAAVAPDPVRDRALRILVDGLGLKGTSRSFAALGIGLAGMNRPDAIRIPLAERIRAELARDSGDFERRGAVILASGMLADVEAAPLLVRLVGDDTEDARVRGAAAVALGLIGDADLGREPVRKALLGKENREMRVDTAVAATLLDDRAAVPALVEILRDTRSSQYTLGSVAMALGRFGDPRAVSPLATLLQAKEGSCPNLIRALAAVALGQIGDRSPVPVLSRISEDVNYRSHYDALGEVLTIL